MYRCIVIVIIIIIIIMVRRTRANAIRMSRTDVIVGGQCRSKGQILGKTRVASSAAVRRHVHRNRSGKTRLPASFRSQSDASALGASPVFLSFRNFPRKTTLEAHRRRSHRHDFVSRSYTRGQNNINNNNNKKNNGTPARYDGVHRLTRTKTNAK